MWRHDLGREYGSGNLEGRRCNPRVGSAAVVKGAAAGVVVDGSGVLRGGGDVLSRDGGLGWRK
jgi:hypothetical protein